MMVRLLTVSSCDCGRKDTNNPILELLIEKLNNQVKIL